LDREVKPIIFSTGLIPKMLKGTKTMTRRTYGLEFVNQNPDKWQFFTEADGIFYFTSDGIKAQTGWYCPYGQVGDRLWERETHWRFGMWKKNGLTKTGKQRWRFKPLGNLIWYMPNPPDWVCKSKGEIGYFKRPSIFMPRWASRITLEITELRVERLQEITEGDAIAEGAMVKHSEDTDEEAGYSFRLGFIDLWDSLNAKRGYSWISNPFVWVISFRRINGNKT